MSTRPKRPPTPHDSVRRPGSTDTGETPRQAVAGVADGRVGDRPTHNRAHAVGADKQLASLLAAIGGSGDDTVVTLLDSRDLDTEAHLPNRANKLSLRSARCRAVVPSSKSEDVGQLTALPGEDRFASLRRRGTLQLPGRPDDRAPALRSRTG